MISYHRRLDRSLCEAEEADRAAQQGTESPLPRAAALSESQITLISDEELKSFRKSSISGAASQSSEVGLGACP